MPLGQEVNMATEINLSFTHPRDSKIESTTCNPSITTAATAVQWLTDGGFLPAQSGKLGGYQLSLDRTGKAIPPNVTFEEAGVQDGDTISISETGAAA
jgi:hypothetical protein